jgi:hypothetical protein
MAFILAVLLSLPASARSRQSTPSRQPGAAGYDAVTCFIEGQAIRGLVQFETTWNGAKWRFASADHRDRFVNAPDKFGQQFGGYCAWAVGRGYTANGDPEDWKAAVAQVLQLMACDEKRQRRAEWPGWEREIDAGQWTSSYPVSSRIYRAPVRDVCYKRVSGGRNEILRRWPRIGGSAFNPPRTNCATPSVRGHSIGEQITGLSKPAAAASSRHNLTHLVRTSALLS